MCLFSLQKLNFEIRLSVLRKDYKSMNKKIFVLFVVLILLISIGGLVAYNQKKLNQNDVNGTTREENSTKEERVESEEVLGKLIINKINMQGEIKEGSSPQVLQEYIGHIEDTAVYDGNVGLAAHNRGTSPSYFARINELEIGDEIIYQNKYGERRYKVNQKKDILETDWSMLQETKENKLTLITCIKNRVNQRLCVQAVESDI